MNICCTHYAFLFDLMIARFVLPTQTSDTESTQLRPESDIMEEDESSLAEEEPIEAVSNVVDDIVDDVITSDTTKPSVSAVVLDTIDDIIQNEAPSSETPKAGTVRTLVTIIDVGEDASSVRSASSSEIHETKDDASSNTESEMVAPPVLPRSPGSRYDINGRTAPVPSGATTVIVNGRAVTPEDVVKIDVSDKKALIDGADITMDRAVPAPKRKSIYEKAKDRGVDKVVMRLNREGKEPTNRQVGWRDISFCLLNHTDPSHKKHAPNFPHPEMIIEYNYYCVN